MFKKFFSIHSKLYSEAVERILSRYKKNELVLPMSNGCAAHIDPLKSKEAARLEVLERDSLILHFFNESQPLLKGKTKPIAKDIEGRYYFFTTNDADVLSCYVFLLSNGKRVSIGYGCGHYKDTESVISKGLKEAIFTYLSHEVATKKTPDISKSQTLNSYYTRYKDEFPPSSLIFKKHLSNDFKEFSFLEEKESLLSNQQEYHKQVWSSYHPFTVTKIIIETAYSEKYARYFSTCKSDDIVTPKWPNFTNSDLKKIESRFKISQNVINKNICPII